MVSWLCKAIKTGILHFTSALGNVHLHSQPEKSFYWPLSNADLSPTVSH